MSVLHNWHPSFLTENLKFWWMIVDQSAWIAWQLRSPPALNKLCRSSLFLTFLALSFSETIGKWLSLTSPPALFWADSTFKLPCQKACTPCSPFTLLLKYTSLLPLFSPHYRFNFLHLPPPKTQHTHLPRAERQIKDRHYQTGMWWLHVPVSHKQNPIQVALGK